MTIPIKAVVVPVLATVAVGALLMNTPTKNREYGGSLTSSSASTTNEKHLRRLRGVLSPIKSSAIVKDSKLVTMGYPFKTVGDKTWRIVFVSGSLAKYAINLQRQTKVLDITGYELEGCSRCLVVQHINNGKSFLKKF